ncbi:MAG: 50S ribosomal protein L11 methyltransferase [Holosporaceae bacterium]|jgi:ribosomal protein L11 methyltransferase|nr:50S ribosomal protein L11 methyltransferase [Holosporaceae bacterium]
MTEKVYKCTIGNFGVNDAFEITDLLFENYSSVSCAEKENNWIIEILSINPLDDYKIRSLLRDYKYTGLEIEELQEEDWLKKNFETFRPIIVGDFFIYGPHLRKDIHLFPKDKIIMEISAATAFGTGAHPTTNRCLIACQTFFDNEKHRNILDIGCGSCILSVALAKLGARHIDACDLDEEAVLVSQKNIALNNVAHRINAFQNISQEVYKKYDFIIANILAEPLISMAESVSSFLNKDSVLILSGFTSDDDSVLQKYLSIGLKLKFKYDYKGWTTLVMTAVF